MPRRARSEGHAVMETVRVVRRHHALVRISHWLAVPVLAGLVASGLAIYWAAPVLQHAPDPLTGNRDYLVDLGMAITRVLPDRAGSPGQWIYDHLSLGRFQLAAALRLHWALAYLFMACGLLYVLGLLVGGGWRALLPRPGDAGDSLRMLRFYVGVVPMAVLRRPWPHPPLRTRYNALQRGAYVAIVLCGALAVLSGWAMHKPVSVGWLERLFVSYDGARVVHFVCAVVLATFVVPHVVLVIADGWDTFRSMVVGWSTRPREVEDERD